MRGHRAAFPEAMIFTLALCNRKIVDAGDAADASSHVRRIPNFRCRNCETNDRCRHATRRRISRNAIARESPQFLDEPVVQFSRPFSRQEHLNGLAPLENSTRLRQRLSVV